jgi:hypothetical protein
MLAKVYLKQHMNKRPGHVKVTVETGYCPFCERVRNLRREEHQLGALVRTIITCETCHRTLSSTIGVASVEPAAVEAPPAEEAASPPEATAPVSETKPKKRAATTAAKPAATRPKSTKTRSTKGK